MAQEYESHPDLFPLILEAGEVVLLNPWTLHGSGTNRSNLPRRAFSVCLMDAGTMSMRYKRLASRSVIFGEGAIVKRPFVQLYLQLKEAKKLSHPSLQFLVKLLANASIKLFATRSSTALYFSVSI